MLFNSVEFLIFLPIVFIIYWAIGSKNIKLQNLFLLIASYFFYGWWDWRFLSLIFFSSFVDFFIARSINKSSKLSRKKLLLTFSLLINLGFLGFFKYYNFFLDSFVEAFTFFGSSLEANRLSIILPVGISFYTFQTLSYTIDVYRNQLKPSNEPIAFFTYVSFFPQLVAGPIERAVNLLPQFYVKRNLDFSLVSSGLKLMLWGFFMKVAVADRLSLYVDNVYSNVDMHSGSSLILGTIFFAFQIYCDFAGYSLIAIGTAKLFGFNLMTNFNRPYFANSFKSFWGRWHISLSSWFRDYVYIPLGGSRNGSMKTNVNLLITFTVSGLWHGANWTFIVWGALHGVYQIIEKTFNKIHLPRVISILFVFILTNLAWIFFRASSINVAFQIIKEITISPFSTLYIGDIGIFLFSILSLIILITHDFIAERFPYIRLFNNKSIIIRFISIIFVTAYILTLGVLDNSQFIYFQF
jgi:alginate O-acetyltransferase complex protein AlgI